LIDRGGEATIGLRQRLDGGDGLLGGDRSGDIGLIACRCGLAADGARRVERMERVVELPMRSRPDQPLVPCSDEAKIIRVALGKLQRQLLLRECRRSGFVHGFKRGARRDVAFDRGLRTPVALCPGASLDGGFCRSRRQRLVRVHAALACAPSAASSM